MRPDLASDPRYNELYMAELAAGRSEERAGAMAAAAVDHERAVANDTDLDTGEVGVVLDDRTRDELYSLARKLDIAGRSTMNKDQLRRAVRNQE